MSCCDHLRRRAGRTGYGRIRRFSCRVDIQRRPWFGRWQRASRSCWVWVVLCCGHARPRRAALVLHSKLRDGRY